MRGRLGQQEESGPGRLNEMLSFLKAESPFLHFRLRFLSHRNELRRDGGRWRCLPHETSEGIAGQEACKFPSMHSGQTALGSWVD